MSAYQKNRIMPEWLTASEAVDIINRHAIPPVSISDIYRHAFYGNITLSIYFQSPVILRRIQFRRKRYLFENAGNNFTDKICHLSNECLINNDNRVIKTTRKNIFPAHYILDTLLSGREYAALQKLLAATLDIPLPVAGHHNIYYGVMVQHNGCLCQVYEYTSRENRLTRQLASLPVNLSRDFREKIKSRITDAEAFDYFPVYQFPDDACFVIRRDMLTSFMQKFFPPPAPHAHASSAVVSTPLSRLLWLACKNNPTISPLIARPYKLTAIFEQWAKEEGITDQICGDTLKRALKRGAPV